MSDMDLKIKKTFKGLRPNYIDNNKLICSDIYDIYIIYLDTLNKQKVGKINTIKRIFSKSRLASRLLRMGISIIKKFNRYYVIYSDHGLYVSNEDFSVLNQIEEVPNRSYQLLDHNICATEKNIYFSEYFSNKNREDVEIWKSSDAAKWDKVYTFPKESIRHVHSIQKDPYENKLWICTGDRNKETMIAKTDYEFNNFKIIGKNKQEFRTLELIFESNSIYWGTDCPYEKNKIMRYKRESEEVKEISNDEFKGPISNLKKVNKNKYLACTWDEGGPEGGGKKTQILTSKNLHDWTCLKSYDKDIYPYLMGYGRVILPIGVGSEIIFYGQGLKGIDNQLLIGELYF
ncbi:MAG: hypothetical protein ACOC85_02635 [Thermoplasmatota archaeon]